MKSTYSLGYISYEGDNILDGAFDARQSANALLGLDSAIKYIIRAEHPELRDVDFTLPVKVREGSWVIDILDHVDELSTIVVGLSEGVLVTTYLKNLVKVAAKDGLLATGPAKDIKKIISGAIKTLKWVSKIKKHIKGESVVEDISENDGNVKLKVGDDEITVPLNEYILYKEMPNNLLDDVAKPISEDVSLVITSIEEDGSVEKERISNDDRSYFCVDENLDNDNEPYVAFPEFEDGMYITIDGRITRYNDKTNTIGFEYLGHILTCEPSGDRSVMDFKHQIISKSEDKFFASANITGTICREGGKKPRLLFDRIEPRDAIIFQGRLF